MIFRRLVLQAPVLFTLCLYSVLSSPSLHAGRLDVLNPRVITTVQGMRVTSAYFDLTNKRHREVTLVNIDSDIADRLEIHRHVTTDGLRKMQRVAHGVAIAPGKTVAFEPGGYHIMIMNLNRVIEDGDNIPLTLRFANGQTQVIYAKAVKSAYNRTSKVQ